MKTQARAHPESRPRGDVPHAPTRTRPAPVPGPQSPERIIYSSLAPTGRREFTRRIVPLPVPLLFDNAAEPASAGLPRQNARREEIKLPLFMAVSFVMSQGSRSNQEPTGLFENS